MMNLQNYLIKLSNLYSQIKILEKKQKIIPFKQLRTSRKFQKKLIYFKE